MLGCSMGTAQTQADLTPTSQTVMIGQGGHYAIPVLAPVENNAPYALTGVVQNNPTNTSVAGVHQNYGQSTLIIPPIPNR